MLTPERDRTRQWTHGDCQLTVSRPAGRAVLAMAIRAGRVTLITGDRHLTVRRPAGSEAPALATRAGARGPRQPEDVAHCPPASRTLHSVHTGPGPVAGPDPARAVHSRQPAGRPRSALTATMPVSPVDGRQWTGRCGLTRILVGAAVTAGPRRESRPPGPRALVIRRLRFVCDRFTRGGPRSHVCLDVACPCSPFLPPFTSCNV